MANIEEKVESLISQKIEQLGYLLYDVEYAKEGANYFLRIFIDTNKETGIDLNDCEKVNNEINELLDQADYIKDQYFLEISSPGIERNITKDRHLDQNIGKQIKIKLFSKDGAGKKEYEAILQKYDTDKIYLEDNIEISRKNVCSIKTVYNW